MKDFVRLKINVAIIFRASFFFSTSALCLQNLAVCLQNLAVCLQNSAVCLQNSAFCIYVSTI